MKKHIRYLLLLACFISLHAANAQSFVSITIDDIPNTAKNENGHYKSTLLNTLDTLQIPIAVFITTNMIDKGDTTQNIALLNAWLQREYITPCYHSYNHLHLAEVGTETFKADFEKGELRLKKLAHDNNKTIKYFRFPYNELGKDSTQQTEIANYLTSKNYLVAPFTIESIDWMFNHLYEYYLTANDTPKAKTIGEKYVSTTIAYFNYFDSLAQQQYNRKINQIYLCHDNPINAAYLPLIITQLKKQNYTFISFEAALKDNIYKQKTHYHQKWGISWLYRWMNNKQEMRNCMKHEPDTREIENLYNQIQTQN